MKILVTGGCGAVGFHTCSYFKQKGYEVLSVDNLERSKLLGHEVSNSRKYYNSNLLKELGVENIELDISDPSTWNIDFRIKDFQPEAIVHLAAQCGVPTSINNPYRDFTVNTLGTILALEYARKCNAKFIYQSTNKVYPITGGWGLNASKTRWEWSNNSWHKKGFPVVPMDTDGGRTPYGASKFCGDILTQEYHSTYGLQTACFRASCLYGTQQFGFSEQAWIAHFVINTLKGDPVIIYGDGAQTRDCLWIPDLVRLYEAFIHQDKSGVWNVGGGPKFTLSLNECLDLLEDITNKRSKITHGDWRPHDQRTYTSDIRPLEEELKWTPIVNPKEGLEKIVKWAEQNLDIF
jgi:CDP-paratose 2-epimerase